MTPEEGNKITSLLVSGGLVSDRDKCWTDVGDVGDEDEEWGCLTSHASRRAKNQHGAIG